MNTLKHELYRYLIATATAVTFAATLGLSACGGGGSSSGTGDENNFAGTFEGGGDTDFKIGPNTDNNYTPTKIIIRPNGKVEVSDGSPNISTSGRLNGDKFESSGRLAFTDNGSSCDMSINYSGTIKEDNGIATATGSVSGSGQCNAQPASFFGVYTAKKISDIAKSPVNSGFKENFRLLF